METSVKRDIHELMIEREWERRANVANSEWELAIMWGIQKHLVIHKYYGVSSTILHSLSNTRQYDK